MFPPAFVLFLACIYGANGRPAVNLEIKVSPAAQPCCLQIPTILLPTQFQVPTLQVNYTYSVPPVQTTVRAPVPATTAASFRLPAATVASPTTPRPVTQAATPATTRAPVATATVSVATQSVSCLGLACFSLLPLVPYTTYSAYSAPLPAPAPVLPYSDPLPYYWGWRGGGGWTRCYWLFC